jgi:hypothetical protein
LNALNFEHFVQILDRILGNFYYLQFDRFRTASCPIAAGLVDSPAAFGTVGTGSDFDTPAVSDFVGHFYTSVPRDLGGRNCSN